MYWLDVPPIGSEDHGWMLKHYGLQHFGEHQDFKWKNKEDFQQGAEGDAANRAL